MLLFAAAWSASAQYYYDRSKNPDRVPVQTTTQDRSRPSNSGSYSKFFFFSWDGNKPLSNTSFVDQASTFGTRLGFRKRINDEDKLWVGGDFGEFIYKQYFPYQTYQSGTQSLSTDLYNYAYNYSLTVNVDYYFLPMENLITPYLGLGLGAGYYKFAQYYNIYGTTGDSWGFLLRPEAGIVATYKKNSPWRLKAAAHYDYSSNSYKDLGYSNFTNLGVQIGIVKMIR